MTYADLIQPPTPPTYATPADRLATMTGRAVVALRNIGTPTDEALALVRQIATPGDTGHHAYMAAMRREGARSRTVANALYGVRLALHP